MVKGRVNVFILIYFTFLTSCELSNQIVEMRVERQMYRSLPGQVFYSKEYNAFTFCNSSEDKIYVGLVQKLENLPDQQLLFYNEYRFIRNESLGDSLRINFTCNGAKDYLLFVSRGCTVIESNENDYQSNLFDSTRTSFTFLLDKKTLEVFCASVNGSFLRIPICNSAFSRGREIFVDHCPIDNIDYSQTVTSSKLFKITTEDTECSPDAIKSPGG